MNVNYLAILIASVLQFIFGAIWYSALFGKLWGQIHDFQKHSKEVQEKMMKEMGPFYGVQFLVTLVTTYILALLVGELSPAWSPFKIAGLAWLGFVVPTQVSGVIFGGTESKWICKKIAVLAGASFGCLQIAAAVFHFYK